MYITTKQTKRLTNFISCETESGKKSDFIHDSEFRGNLTLTAGSLMATVRIESPHHPTTSSGPTSLSTQK